MAPPYGARVIVHVRDECKEGGRSLCCGLLGSACVPPAVGLGSRSWIGWCFGVRLTAVESW